jgi:dolichol-phosphate mannosyltransferase
MIDQENISLAGRLSSYLRKGIISPRLLKFGAVGLTGIGVNMGSLYLLTEFGKVPYFIGSLVAIELSILSNFWMNHVWTWRDRSEVGTFWTKLWRYHVGAGITALLGNYLILIGLTELFGINYLISNFIGIAVGTFSNYVINDVWTFKKRT